VALRLPVRSSHMHKMRIHSYLQSQRLLAAAVVFGVPDGMKSYRAHNRLPV